MRTASRVLEPQETAERLDDRTAVVWRSLLSPRVDGQLRALERSSRVDRDPTAALRETVEAIWKIVEQAAPDRMLEASGHGARALLARRELVRRGTGTLSRVIRRGIASGVFQPRCASWAIRRLPFAIVAGACAHWVVGLSAASSLRASTAVAGAIEVLRPGCSAGDTATSYRLEVTARQTTELSAKAPRRATDVRG